jgi:DNA-binding MarR family transcriptional regulator
MKLIHKERDKTNKRKFLVNLTNKGLEEYDEGKKIIAEELKKIFEAISVHEKQQIIKSLEKVGHFLYDEAAILCADELNKFIL